MKTPLHSYLALLAAALTAGSVVSQAQGFNAGSDGSLGDVVIDANTTLPLPPDGKLHYKSLTVNTGVRLNFTRNARNTPVFILSQGDVVVNGTIDVNGGAGSINSGGLAGPGGFDGGRPGFGAEVPPGDGYGPGGGKGGVADCNPNSAAGVGGGSYGTSKGSRCGPTYGGSLLIPMVGGSGGGGRTGQPGIGGGGGGGAILIVANTRVVVAGLIESRGGGVDSCASPLGSGGGIRLVAPKVEGAGRIDVRSAGAGGHGRIRVDTIDRTSLNFDFQENAQTTVGGNLLSFPPVVPRLDTIEVAGNAVPVGGNPATFLLPFGSTPNRTVKVQASDFGRAVPIRITLTPDTGERVTVDAEVDNTAGGSTVIEVPVVVPVNTLVTVHCWTR